MSPIDKDTARVALRDARAAWERGDAARAESRCRDALAADAGEVRAWTLLGVVLLIIAAVYFLVPADQLPGFFPGHEIGAMRMHYKHGVVSGVAGLVLIGAGIWTGRR